MKFPHRLSTLAFGSLFVFACNGDDTTEGVDTNGTTGMPTTGVGVTLTTTQTTAPTTDPTDPDTTTGDDDPTVDGDTTTGEDTTGDTTNGDETTATDDTTGGAELRWQPCFGEGDDGCLRDEVCLVGAVQSIFQAVTFCSVADCTTADDCPMPPGGDAPVACAPVGENNRCIIDCSGGEACPPGMECFNNQACGHPTNWSCPAAYYGDDECDCGCGITDVDCADMTLASCQACSVQGGCSNMPCDGNTQIDPDDNAVCL